jgi:hypothetical protein
MPRISLPDLLSDRNAVCNLNCFQTRARVRFSIEPVRLLSRHSGNPSQRERVCQDSARGEFIRPPTETSQNPRQPYGGDFEADAAVSYFAAGSGLQCRNVGNVRARLLFH